MKKLLSAALLLCGLFAASVAQALTLDWDRNTEADMKDYGVYACFAVGCSIIPGPATFQAFVVQSAVGVRPSWPIPAGKQGNVGVTARDTALNESGLSVTVPFDAVAPGIPINPAVH